MVCLSLLPLTKSVGWSQFVGFFLTKTNFTTKNWLLKNSGQSCDSDTKDKSKLEKVFHLKKLAVKNICKDQNVFFECS